MGVRFKHMLEKDFSVLTEKGQTDNTLLLKAATQMVRQQLKAKSTCSR